MSNSDSIRQRILRRRSKRGNRGKSVRSYQDLELVPDTYRENLRFTLEIQGGKYIWIFLTEEGKSVLKDTSIWACDGTHRKSPIPFKQIYIVCGVHDHHALPAAFCLLPNHLKETYDIVFQFLKSNLDYSPEKIIMDFEIAAINSFLKHNLSSRITGCHFHWKQNMRKNMRKRTIFEENEAMEKVLKMIYTLPFIPPGFVVQSFTDYIEKFLVDNKLDNHAELKVFMNYLVKYYIGKPWAGKARKRGRHAPVFAINHWNIFHEYMGELPATNNSLEQLNGEFNKNQPGSQTIYSFIEGINRELQFAIVKRREIDSGVYQTHAAGRNHSNLKIKRRIKAILLSFSIDDLDGFFSSMSYYV